MPRQTPLSRARARTSRFRQFRRSTGHGHTPASMPVATRPVAQRGPEHEFVYWHPNREGAEPAPETIMREIRLIHPGLRIVKSPVHQRWLVWFPSPAVQHPLCAGWQLVLVWEHPRTGEYLPLSVELLGFNLYLLSRDHIGGNNPALRHFERVQDEIQRKRAARDRQYHENRRAEQRELLDGRRISTAGAGNRFAMHHDGSVVPSQGEINWRLETEKWRIPKHLQQRRQQDREKMRAAGVAL